MREPAEIGARRAWCGLAHYFNSRSQREATPPRHAGVTALQRVRHLNRSDEHGRAAGGQTPDSPNRANNNRHV